MRQIGQRGPGLWSDIQTNKQELSLYIFRFQLTHSHDSPEFTDQNLPDQQTNKITTVNITTLFRYILAGQPGS